MNWNKVQIAGRLARDPQLRYLPSNEPVCDFTVVVNWKFAARDGTFKDNVAFVECKAYGVKASTINQHFRKGKEIFIEGRLDYSEWTAKDVAPGQNAKRSKLTVAVIEFEFVGPRSAADQAEQSSYDDGGGHQSGEDRQQRRPQQPRYTPAPLRPGQQPAPDIKDEDIPF